MRKFIFTLVILFFSKGIIYSQSEFRNGYVIKNNNDTIFGLINYSSIVNFKKCVFKKNTHSEIIEFVPNEIKAYRFIDGKYYISKQLETNKTKDLIFLEFLINGIVDIYLYRDSYGDHYFIDKGDSILIELKNEKKTIVLNNIEYQKESKEYIGTLKYIFQNSPSVSKKADRVSLNSKSLIDITREYHENICSNEECIIYEKKIPKLRPQLEIGLLIGLNVYNENIINREVKYLEHGNLKTEYTPSLGFILKIGIPNLSKNFQLEYWGTFNRSKSTLLSSYQETVFNTTITNDISLKQNSLNSALYLRYEYAKGKLRPTLKLGYFYNIYSNVKYINTYNSKWSNGDPYESYVYYDNIFPEKNYGISLGAGINMRITNYKIFLDFTYRHGNEETDPIYNKNGIIINRSYKNLNSNSYSIELGVLFGK
jgi:hypothetical protein